MGKKENSSDDANTIETQRVESEKKGDPNAKPRVIRRGDQKHPKYQRNKIQIAATIPKK